MHIKHWQWPYIGQSINSVQEKLLLSEKHINICVGKIQQFYVNAGGTHNNHHALVSHFIQV
jgi:hypothetical protein